MKKIIVIFVLFIVGLESLNLYINNEYQDSFSDGSERFPFKTFLEALAFSNIQTHQNSTIIYEFLSNSLEYELNSSTNINQNVIILFKSSKNEKVELKISSKGSFYISCNLINLKKYSLKIN